MEGHLLDSPYGHLRDVALRSRLHHEPHGIEHAANHHRADILIQTLADAAGIMCSMLCQKGRNPASAQTDARPAPSPPPGYLNKEIFLCYNAITVQPGTAMTVKEMPGGVSAPPVASREGAHGESDRAGIHHKHRRAGGG
jgi:hypothetical protein